MRMWGTVAAVLIALCGSVARAGETFPSDIRTITADGATSSCIGAPKTPLCAAETFLACDSRQDKSLCRRVGVERTEFQLPPYDLRYRILSVRILKPEDIPPDFRDSPFLKPGDAEMVFLEFPPPPQHACPDGCKYDYIARSVNGEWRIVDWAMWGLDD
ncbi:hypothetical protein [Oleispirillum naphthae]|uniref:hypothetical protein n=1 Tax=Oleispirillum naphthae TaxID=2838853 RepID=UPI00308238B7